MANVTISYQLIAEFSFACNQNIKELLELVTTSYTEIKSEDLTLFKRFLNNSFIPNLKRRMQACHRIRSVFFERNTQWLSKIYSFENTENHEEPCCSYQSKRGRPFKSFEDVNSRSKKNKIVSFCEQNSHELIVSAAHSLQEPTSIKKISLEKALSLIIDTSLSKHQYQVLRNVTKEEGYDIFPEYRQVILSKKQCYPDNIKVEENYAKVTLQDLLDHTAKRILETKPKQQLNNAPTELKLLCKWGCDGSSGHSEYHQKFSNTNNSDKNMFLTSIVPLTLTDSNNFSLVCWKNTEPSSTRYCRPLKFEFIKETSNVINEEINRVENEICNLKQSVVELEGKTFNITHSLTLTMIDGKVASSITNTSSMAVCFICGSKPTEMNDLNKVLSKPNSEEALKFGISPLHARIKFMECILHIGYNKSFKAWRTNKVTKEQKEAEKANIQKRLKNVLGINVDIVKQGMGSTNDGNTSRRFFENPNITANIVGVDEKLIHRFKIILATINSNAAINVTKFEEFCLDTAKLYIELYSWYYMPITVHKVLMHGSKIISAAILPIGMLSEEAQEAKNKDYREHKRLP